MNKYFVIGLITAFVGFGIYDITKTIKVKKEIERNKKIRQEKYELRTKIKGVNKLMDDIEKKLADNESAFIQGLITLDEYEANCNEILATSILIPKALRSNEVNRDKELKIERKDEQ